MVSDANSSGVDKTDPTIRKAQLDYMRAIEEANRERVQKLLKLRRKNIATGSLIGAFVLGIYGYSMYAVKQETFLDDFREPTKIIKE